MFSAAAGVAVVPKVGAPELDAPLEAFEVGAIKLDVVEAGDGPPGVVLEKVGPALSPSPPSILGT